MVKGNKLRALSLTALLAASALAGVARADQMSDQVFDESSPKGGAMILDALMVRPFMLGATVVGSGLFVLSSPFALVGGNVGESWDTLVVTPARSTFVRCLGCTPIQDEHLRAERKTERVNEGAEGSN